MAMTGNAAPDPTKHEEFFLTTRKSKEFLPVNTLLEWYIRTLKETLRDPTVVCASIFFREWFR